MLETTIEDCLKKDSVTSKIFLGVFARDELPKKVKYPSCFIFNTKPRNHSGEHWVSVFYDQDGRGIFFDSYGQSAKTFRMQSYMDKTSILKPYSNLKRIQGNSTYCGYYCMLFLLTAARGQTQKFFDYFGDDYLKNDKKLAFLINKYKK